MNQPVAPTLLPAFSASLNVALVGATGGIGRAFYANLRANKAVANLIALSRSPIEDGEWLHLDLTKQETIEAAASQIKSRLNTLDLVIVSTGMLHDDTHNIQPEKTWRHLDANAMQTAFAVNTIGPALVAKHFLPLLNRTQKTAFAAISARVGSIADNRIGGWYAYRASKAALNQIIKSAAIELARSNPNAICVGLHPGTVDTGLSKPFQRGVADGKLFTPAQSADYMLTVLNTLKPEDSGQLFAWDGKSIPF